MYKNYGNIDKKESYMKKNLIIILSIFVIPIFVYYFLDSSQAKNSNNEVTSGKPQIIKFYSSMCYDCQRLEKTMGEVYPSYSDKINYKGIQTQERDRKTLDLIKEYNVTLVPTTIFMNKNGEILRRVEGFMDKDELKKYMEELING